MAESVARKPVGQSGGDATPQLQGPVGSSDWPLVGGSAPREVYQVRMVCISTMNHLLHFYTFFNSYKNTFSRTHISLRHNIPITFSLRDTLCCIFKKKKKRRVGIVFPTIVAPTFLIVVNKVQLLFTSFHLLCFLFIILDAKNLINFFFVRKNAINFLHSFIFKYTNPEQKEKQVDKQNLTAKYCQKKCHVSKARVPQKKKKKKLATSILLRLMQRLFQNLSSIFRRA